MFLPFLWRVVLAAFLINNIAAYDVDSDGNGRFYNALGLSVMGSGSSTHSSSDSSSPSSSSSSSSSSSDTEDDETEEDDDLKDVSVLETSGRFWNTNTAKILFLDSEEEEEEPSVVESNLVDGTIVNSPSEHDIKFQESEEEPDAVSGPSIIFAYDAPSELQLVAKADFERSLNHLSALFSKSLVSKSIPGTPLCLSPKARKLTFARDDTPTTSSSSSSPLKPRKSLKPSKSVPNLKRDKNPKKWLAHLMEPLSRSMLKDRIGHHDILSRLPPYEILMDHLQCPTPGVSCKFPRNRGDQNAEALVPSLSVSVIRTRNNELFALSDEILGSGIFSVVKVAVNIKTGEKIAVKISPLRNDATHSLRWDAHQNEVEVLSALDRHLDSFVEFKTDEKGFAEAKGYILMDFIQGQCLDKLDWNGMSIEQLQILENNTDAAIDEMFELGYVHRDPHAENVIVDPISLHVSFIDFGQVVKRSELKLEEFEFRRDEIKRVMSFRTWKAISYKSNNQAVDMVVLFSRDGDEDTESGYDTSFGSRASSWDPLSDPLSEEQ